MLTPGNAAAVTALPQPPSTSQKVPSVAIPNFYNVLRMSRALLVQPIIDME